jgi:hypothetical protein
MIIKLLGRLLSKSRVQNLSNFPAIGTGASVAVAGLAAHEVHIHKVLFGYDSDPTGGLLTVTDGSKIQKVPVTKGGPGAVNLNYIGSIGSTVTITLSAGGGAVTGYLNVDASLEPA